MTTNRATNLYTKQSKHSQCFKILWQWQWQWQYLAITQAPKDNYNERIKNDVEIVDIIYFNIKGHFIMVALLIMSRMCFCILYKETTSLQWLGLVCPNGGHYRQVLLQVKAIVYTYLPNHYITVTQFQYILTIYIAWEFATN